MKTVNITILALLVGGTLGFGANHYLSRYQSLVNEPSVDEQSRERNSTSNQAGASAKTPLYWVAPMDPNYKRDKPGKSPMGMDLIPVYPEKESAIKDSPGTVTIDPSVKNNLGVTSEKVKRIPLTARIETIGYVAFDQSRLWQTNTRVSGWVEKLYVHAVGEQVEKGQVLFQLYSPELVKAQEELINASSSDRTGLVRGATERLIALGVDRMQISQIIQRGKASQTIDIKALNDGIVASLNLREGSYLSPAQSVLSAGPIDEVWVDAEIFERQAQWIVAGSEASMRLDAIPSKEWRGTVDYIYPILDAATRTLRVRLKFPNPHGELKPNMFANITLSPVSHDTVLTVPRSAVIRSGDMSRVVLAQGDGKYRSARIEIGREADDRLEVLDGLTEQDHVVTSAHFMLDSESSQTADLTRINSNTPVNNSIWMTGKISMLMTDFGMVTISHQPVTQWGWDAGEMNFSVGSDIKLSSFSEGQNVQFQVEKQGKDYILNQLKQGDSQ
jgi:membrane fusion protein, copper/silver efflux system